MSKYLNAERLERNGWYLKRTVTYSTSATGGYGYTETLKPTDYPAADVVEIKDVIGILAKYRYNLATSVWEFCEELCALCGVTDRESTYQKYSARTDEVE